jgi:polyisoprenoid-binding protein YceI
MQAGSDPTRRPLFEGEQRLFVGPELSNARVRGHLTARHLSAFASRSENSMYRYLPVTALVAAIGLATPAAAAPEKYVLDPSHSQIVFSYNHLGYSTNYAMFSGFEGEIQFDQADPAASSVTVAFPVKTMLTGWQARFDHFMSPDFFAATEDEMVGFASTGIEVTSEKTAKITGDLTLNGVTLPVVLDVVLNQAGDHPMENKPWAGFSATTTVLRSAFGLGAFAPFISDEVKVDIQIEAMKAD